MTSALTVDEAVASIQVMALEDDNQVQAETPPLGMFAGLPFDVRWNLDGRTGTLLRPVGFEEADGTDWPVPEGAWLDGASIPRPFWSIIGGPYEGKFREASVIHDHYCITKFRTWQATHRMFWAAMLTRGVGGLKARAMYYAVYRFGPRWSLGVGAESAASPSEALTNETAESILRDAAVLETMPMDREQIEQLAEASRGI